MRDLDEVEVGWSVVPERWRQGLATELALASIDVAFGPLDLDQVVAFTLPDNVASRRVMEKAGFAYDRDILHVGLAARALPPSATPPGRATPGAAEPAATLRGRPL